MNLGAFYWGNARPAWLGGLVSAAGLRYTAPNGIGAAVAGGALLLAVLCAFWSAVTVSPSRW